MISRKVTKDELQRTEDLFCVAFEFKATDTPILGEDPTRFATFNDNGEMMAFLCSPTQVMLYDNGTVNTSCIGAVSTLPQYRRAGALKGAFIKSLENSYDVGDDFSCLFPFSSTYYRKFGYEYVIGKNLYTLSLLSISAYDVGGSMALNEKGSELDNIKGIYHAFASKYNCMLARESDKYFKDVISNEPSKDGKYTYVYKDKNGMAKAAFSFEKVKTDKGFDMQCNYLWYKDAEGLKSVLSFAKGFATYYNNIIFSLPQDVDMKHYIAEWALYPMNTAVVTFGMMRVINVQSVLAKSAYIGSGNVIIKITDNQIPQNNNTFELIFENGKAKSVEITTKAEDVHMPIHVLSRLICGADTADSLNMYDDVVVTNSKHLSQIFYKKASFIANSF